MTMSLAELAALPTAPTVSEALARAAHYTDQGPFLALRRATFGSTTFEDFIAVIIPEHGIAEGWALVVVASLIDPEVRAAGMPDSTWTAGGSGAVVSRAHGVLDGWAQSHTAEELGHLFEAAAVQARSVERDSWAVGW